LKPKKHPLGGDDPNHPFVFGRGGWRCRSVMKIENPEPWKMEKRAGDVIMREKIDAESANRGEG